MAFLLLPIVAVFLLGIVSVYGIQEPMGDLLLLSVFIFVVTLTLFFAWAKEIQTQMIETLLIVVIVGIVAAPLLLYRKTDNTKWLEFRDAAEECLTRYKGDDKKTVEMLVKRFGDLCMQIAACTSYWDSKRGMLLAKEATRITMELQRRGFMEKSRKVSDEN